VTTLRRDVETDGRRALVHFTTDWVADAKRRDFTMNAIAYDPLNERLIDPFDGAVDLAARVTRGEAVPPDEEEREPARAKEKAARLAPAIEAAMARRVDDAPTLPEGYTLPAMPRAWADRTGSPELKEMLEKFADDRAAGNRDPGLGILG